MSPEMIQGILTSSSKTENELSQEIIVPCLHAFSIRNGYRLRDIRFTGGTSELGNDIQYYEVFGPDHLRFYTGIQVKKGNVSQSDAGNVIRQGEEAFEKTISDIRSGQTYRINRWVLLGTGSVTQPAQQQIIEKLKRYGKPIHFWDGLWLSALIMEHFYNDFVQRLGVEPQLAASQNRQTILWDPDRPIILAENFCKLAFTTLDIRRAVHELAVGIFLTVRPRDRNIPSVRCVIRSNAEELIIDSLHSQLQPYLLHMNAGDNVEAMVLDNSRPIDILARGYLDVL